jgi:outer membrane protein assembly factor BamB
MRIPSFRLALRGLLWLGLCSSALFCHAYTYLQVGVDSNFLIDGGRVLFAQADGSLTALALDTGKVLARDRTRDYSGMLERVPQGILLLNDRTIALLDPNRFDMLWETSFHCEPNILGDALVSCDANGRVECRNLANGKPRWSYELPGTLALIAASGRVLVHRAATYDEGSLPTTALLDLLDGKVLFRQVATNGVLRPATFFDGTNIYVETGSFQERRADYEPVRLAVWNIAGQETGSLPLPPELRQVVRDGRLFELGGMTFWRGHVYADRQSIPFERRGKSGARTQQANGTSGIFESEYDLGDGVRLIERARYLGGAGGRNAAFVMELEARTRTNHWTGVLPYLPDGGRITAIGKADGKIVIGTDRGQVECLAAETGMSLWLYNFPTLRRTVSYGQRRLPPTMSEAAAMFRQDNDHPPTSGLQVFRAKAGKPIVVADPDPIHPYRKLPLHLAVAWSAAGVGFGLMLLGHVLAWVRRWEASVPGAMAAWLTFLLFCACLFYGHVSPDSSLALRIAVFTGFVFGMVDAILSYRRRLWMEGTMLLLILGAIAVFAFLAMA